MSTTTGTTATSATTTAAAKKDTSGSGSVVKDSTTTTGSSQKVEDKMDEVSPGTATGTSTSTTTGTGTGQPGENHEVLVGIVSKLLESGITSDQIIPLYGEELVRNMGLSKRIEDLENQLVETQERENLKLIRDAGLSESLYKKSTQEYKDELLKAARMSTSSGSMNENNNKRKSEVQPGSMKQYSRESFIPGNFEPRSRKDTHGDRDFTQQPGVKSVSKDEVIDMTSRNVDERARSLLESMKNGGDMRSKFSELTEINNKSRNYTPSKSYQFGSDK
jgi:hypothetical protein